MMLDVDGIAVLITNEKGANNLLSKCWNLIKSKKQKLKHRRICCIKLLRNVAMQSLGQSVLIKYLLPRNQRFDEMVNWLEIDDDRFRRICCEFYRNLGFIAEFKTVFANHRELLLGIFTLILDDDGDGDDDQQLVDDEEGQYQALRTMLDTKLSLITLIWIIVHKNSNHIALITNFGAPSLRPLLQRLEALQRMIRRRPHLQNDRDLQILFNSLLDRTKLVLGLLNGI